MLYLLDSLNSEGHISRGIIFCFPPILTNLNLIKSEGLDTPSPKMPQKEMCTHPGRRNCSLLSIIIT